MRRSPTIHEAAEDLGVSPTTIRRWIKRLKISPDVNGRLNEDQLGELIHNIVPTQIERTEADVAFIHNLLDRCSRPRKSKAQFIIPSGRVVGGTLNRRCKEVLLLMMHCMDESGNFDETTFRRELSK